MINFYKSGMRKVKLRKYKDAITAFTKAIDANPKDADSYYQRGFAKYKIGDFVGAWKDFNVLLRKQFYTKMKYTKYNYQIIFIMRSLFKTCILRDELIKDIHKFVKSLEKKD